MQALIITFLVGLISFPIGINTKHKVINRMNTGKPVKLAGEVIGYVVVVRYNGIKRWTSVVNQKVGLRAFYNQDEAISDVTNRHLENVNPSENNRPARPRDLHFA